MRVPEKPIYRGELSKGEGGRGAGGGGGLGQFPRFEWGGRGEGDYLAIFFERPPHPRGAPPLKN